MKTLQGIAIYISIILFGAMFIVLYSTNIKLQDDCKLLIHKYDSISNLQSNINEQYKIVIDEQTSNAIFYATLYDITMFDKDYPLKITKFMMNDLNNKGKFKLGDNYCLIKINK